MPNPNDGPPGDSHTATLSVRTIIEGAMKDATRYANDIAKSENDEDLNSVRKSGKTQVLALTPDERKALKKALTPVHKQMESRIGAELIQAIYKETGFNPAE